MRYLLILCDEESLFADNMKLYVNARFLSQPVSGVQRYGIECCRKIKKKHKECILLAPHNIHNKDAAQELGVEIIGTRTGHLWEQTELPHYLKKLGSPPLFNPCNTAPLSYANNFITLHDLAFHHYPRWNSRAFALWYNYMVPRIVRRSRHMFTVSNTVKDEIIKAYHIPAGHISITPNGIGQSMLDAGAGTSVKQPVVLTVGSFNKRKNHHSLIKAFCDSDLGSRYRLVITGDRNKVFSDTGLDDAMLADKNITLLKGLSETELADSYRTAKVVISLSHYEGFGIPLLEGVYYGCNIVCSDIPVYRELYNDIAFFCRPDTSANIVAAIEAAMTAVPPAPDKVSALLHKYNYQQAADEIVRAMTT